jgi:hypothetical protein
VLNRRQSPQTRIVEFDKLRLIALDELIRKRYQIIASSGSGVG